MINYLFLLFFTSCNNEIDSRWWQTQVNKKIDNCRFDCKNKNLPRVNKKKSNSFELTYEKIINDRQKISIYLDSISNDCDYYVIEGYTFSEKINENRISNYYRSVYLSNRKNNKTYSLKEKNGLIYMEDLKEEYPLDISSFNDRCLCNKEFIKYFTIYYEIGSKNQVLYVQIW
jgi:hypothetical protein